MKRFLVGLLVVPIAAFGGLVVASGHVAVTGNITDKPYTATTPDSGRCGNNWAIDLFTRSFTVSPPALDGTTKVVEKFISGRFITLGDGETGSAASPGQCDSGANSTHMLREGVSGSFTGSFTIIVNSGFSYTPNKGCGSTEPASGASTDDGCTTKQWIELAFPGATYGINFATATVTAYSLTYNAVGLGLLGTTWTDASTGDSGDIYTS